MGEDASRVDEHGAGGAEQLGRLRALVQEYQVCWEKRPERAVAGGGR